MWIFFYDYQIYIDISDRHIYQIPFVVKNVENALRDRTFIYFNIEKKVSTRQVLAHLTTNAYLCR